MLRLLIIGSPGSGKGTLSLKLQHKYPQLNFISTGDLLRNHIHHKTPIGISAQTTISQGEFISDELMKTIVYQELVKIKSKSWLLDGFPRNSTQAQVLDRLLFDLQTPLNAVLHLNVPESAILERIMDRYIHAPSGRVYSNSYNPPKIPGVDDITGELLSKRPDDDVDVFRKRLLIYNRATLPLIDYYKQKGILYSFSGTSSDKLYPLIQETINGLLISPNI